MTRYLVQASYTSEAIAAFVSNPQERTAGINAVAESLGCKVEQIDFCLGEYDVIGVMSCPDDTTAAALSLAVNAPGHLKSFRTTRLMSESDFVEAQRKANSVNYQAPKKA